MPALIKGKVCAITFTQQFTDEPPETIIGTWTGEIDTWGKHTIALLDAEAGGPYYLFADEVLAVEVCSEAEVQAERDAILESRYDAGLTALQTALAQFEAAKQGAMAAAVRGLLREAGR